MNKKIIFIYYLLFIVSFSVSAQDRSLNFELRGKQYDKLQITLSLPDGLIPYKVEMKSLGNDKWNAMIPDSIFSQYCYLRLDAVVKDSLSNSIILFKAVRGEKDSCGCSDILFFENMEHLFVKAKFTEEYRMKNRNKPDECMYVYTIEKADEETILSQEVYHDYFRLLHNNITHREISDYYLKLIVEHPNSRSLITLVAEFFLKYNYNVEDLKRMYNSFSSQNKQSYYGKRIEDYIARRMNFIKFENVKLPRHDTNKEELIISNPDKYQLVVFSASWCGPCHKQIPVLKGIYDDLNSKLDIVYISIDEKRTVKEWNQLMITEKIPWKSFLAKDNVKLIQDKYFIQSIPTTYLIYPDGKFKLLDVRKEEDKRFLYELCH